MDQFQLHEIQHFLGMACARLFSQTPSRCVRGPLDLSSVFQKVDTPTCTLMHTIREHTTALSL